MSKFTILFALVTLSIQFLCAQESALELLNERQIVLNFDNHIKIAVEGVHCDSIYVESEAQIMKLIDCNWNIKPTNFPTRSGLEVNIFKLSNFDTIFVERKVLSVRLLKPIQPHISQIKNLDTISSSRLNFEQGIFGSNHEWEITGCFSVSVKNFNCLLIRDGKVIGFESNIGPNFNQKCKDLFKILETNDQIHFINIVADSPYRKDEQLSSIKLYIK